MEYMNNINIEMSVRNYCIKKRYQIRSSLIKPIEKKLKTKTKMRPISITESD